MNINSQLVHSIRTEEICNKIRLSIKISTGIESGIPGDYGGDDEESAEHWSFEIPDTIQLQAITCVCCGDYVCSAKNILHKNTTCKCRSEFDTDEDVKKNKKNKKMEYERMNDYAALETFIGEVLPEGARDRLCEDVIGEISRFLVV